MTEVEFLESMKTGKDFADSEGAPLPSRMIIMPSQNYRFMVDSDLRAI